MELQWEGSSPGDCAACLFVFLTICAGHLLPFLNDLFTVGMALSMAVTVIVAAAVGFIGFGATIRKHIRYLR